MTDSSSIPTRSPQSALYQNDTGFELTVDLPGVDADSIKLELKGHQLHLLAPTSQGFQYQRSYTFKSTFSWGEPQTRWESGRLYLTLPTIESLTRTIPIASV